VRANGKVDRIGSLNAMLFDPVQGLQQHHATDPVVQSLPTYRPWANSSNELAGTTAPPGESPIPRLHLWTWPRPRSSFYQPVQNNYLAAPRGDRFVADLTWVRKRTILVYSRP
jgi:hypothetical protein